MAKTSILDAIKNDPATKALAENLGQYAAAKISTVGQPKGKSSQSQPSESVGMMDKLKGGALSGTGEAMQSGGNKLFGGITGAVKGLFSRKGKAAKRPTNIIECYPIPLSAEEAYEAWTEYQNHAGYMKGVEKVDVGKEAENEKEGGEVSNWTAKIFLSRRSWKATTEEVIYGERIRWKSEGNKGTVDGMVSFHPAGDNMCWMFFILEYRPKGLMEWTGNRWRTVGRRARLDVKHFIRHTAMQDQSDKQEEDDKQDERQDENREPEMDKGPDETSEETQSQDEENLQPVS